MRKRIMKREIDLLFCNEMIFNMNDLMSRAKFVGWRWNDFSFKLKHRMIFLSMLHTNIISCPHFLRESVE